MMPPHVEQGGASVPCFTAALLAASGILACDSQIDPECRALWEVLRRVPGITPIACCSGHATAGMSFWLTVERLDWLPLVLHACTSSHLGYGWTCTVTMDYAYPGVVFCLRSCTRGDAAAGEAQAMATTLQILLDGDA